MNCNRMVCGKPLHGKDELSDRLYELFLLVHEMLRFDGATY